MNSEFVVHRLATLLEKPEFVDIILNGVRYGECFVLEDFEMSFDMAVRHVMDSSGAHLVIKTACRRLKRGVGILTSKQFAIVKKPYFVVKRGAVKNTVRNLMGKSGRIVQWKQNGSVMADFDGEIIELPRGIYKIRLK